MSKNYRRRSLNPEYAYDEELTKNKKLKIKNRKEYEVIKQMTNCPCSMLIAKKWNQTVYESSNWREKIRKDFHQMSA